MHFHPENTAPEKQARPTRANRGVTPKSMARIALLAADLALSFMWVWAGALAKIIVSDVVGIGHHPEGEILKYSLSVIYMFFFAWLGSVTRGAAYNPLTVLSAAFQCGMDGFLFTALGRIPAQVIGSVIGVRLITRTFPQLGRGPRLNVGVGIHHGALTEGALTFMISMVAMGLKKKDPKNFFMKTWISSISKLTLHVLGSDLTGGVMNPASAVTQHLETGKHGAPMKSAETILGFWMGICSWRSYNIRASVCVLARSCSRDCAGSDGIQVVFRAHEEQGARRARQEG